MVSQNELSELASLLQPLIDNTRISAERREELMQRGAVSALEEAAVDTPEAVVLLQETAGNHQNTSVRSQALQGLIRLAQEGQLLAVDSLYRLAVENDSLAARQAILVKKWQPQRSGLRALFDWFTYLSDGKPFPENDLLLLTEAYFSDASSSLQLRLQATAAQNRAENWSRIVSAVQNLNHTVVEQLVEKYPSFRPVERKITLDQLSLLASQGSVEARSGLARLFIRYEDLRARDILLSSKNLPDDAEQRALFFFLVGDWDSYKSLDFDNHLLVNAYEHAGRTLRRRLLEHSRHSGQGEWLRSMNLSTSGDESSSAVRWIHDLTDADWEVSIQRLLEGSRHNELWKLAQVAPPVWGAVILSNLQERGWCPEEPDQREGFQNLADHAARCKTNPFTVGHRKSLQAPSTDIQCISLHPTGRILAAGSSDQRLMLWSLPDGQPAEPGILSPTPVTRTMAFSPDGELIACAGGDNRIRVFRFPNGQLLKTLDGHRAMIRGLAIHPDGRTLYSAGFDGYVRLWRFPHGAALKTIRPGPGEIFSLALGSGGSHLLSAGADSIVQVWSLPEGVLSRELIGHSSTITLLATSLTGELAASAGRDGMLRLWNFTSGGLLRTIPFTSALTSLCMHPNEQVLVGGGSSGEITIWNLSTGRVLEMLSGHRKAVTGLVISPQGDRLYSADSGGTILIWDLQAFIEIRLAAEHSRPGAAVELQGRLKDAGATSAEKRWIEFAAALALWRQRFDIELAEPTMIPVGEFDIEIS